MWKNLNKILHDRNDYHLDPLLKQDVEIFDDLFQTTIKYQKNLIPRKIKYFFQYDKLFFLRLAAKYLLKLFIFLLIVGTVVIVSLLAFGIDINVKKVPRTNYSQFTVYVPSSGKVDQDSLTISNYRKTFGKETKYIIFYMKDPSKDYKEWKNKLQGIESNDWKNPYEARREGSQYWGKYQMGESARKEINLDNITWEKWKSNPEIQEAALRLWIDILYQYLKNDIKIYDGTFQNGWSITESGIIAMAHNVGPDPVKDFLHSGGKKIPKDGSGKDATRFLILGNYDLEINK
jgi:hypothetical protein